MSIFMFLIFRYIAIRIDKWKHAVLFKESYRYIDMPHINDTPTESVGGSVAR